ncbi:hypothetical protein [Anoxybacteroides tepidamans]|uniref:hypothetical protein n=1 Tax=Anoxybacteroides tepidamans TaxID=265948 RepID=UPI0006866EA1|nr:hypothetical protein [Anoxybacillus tepidamans]
MDKKKAIKLATASAVAASAFVAANPHASEAAVNVDAVVKQAKTSFKAVYNSYKSVATTGKLVDVKNVQAKVTAADKAYANAVATVKKYGGKKKDAYLADLEKSYKDNVVNGGKNYIKAYGTLAKVETLHAALKDAVAAKDLAKVESNYHQLSAALKNAAALVKPIYGAGVRAALLENIDAATTTKNGLIYDVTVYMKLTAADAAVKADKLEDAEKALADADKWFPQVAQLKAELTALQTTVKAAYEAKVTPKVVSVSAVNAKELVVKFNVPLKKDSVIETVSGVSTLVDGTVKVDGGAADSLEASLSSDGKELTIRSATNWEGTHSLEIIADKFEATNGKKVGNYTTAFNYDDTTRASITGVTYVDKYTYKVNFSEPVTSVGTVTANYADGSAVTLNTSATGYGLSADGKSFTVVFDSATAVNKEITVNFPTITDFGSNISVPSTAKITISDADKAKPVVTSVVSTSPTTVKVKFSESVKLLDATKVSFNGVALTTADVTVDSNDKTTLNITVPSTTTSGVIAFAAGAVEDLNKNTNDVFSQTVSFSHDKIAPQVVSTEVIRVSGLNNLKVTFSEEVSKVGTALTLKYIDEYGVQQTVTIPAAKINVDSNDKKVVYIQLHDGTSAIKEGVNYTVDIPAGFFKDAFQNDSVAKTVSFSNSTSSTTNKLALISANPVVYGIDAKGAYIDVRFADAVNPATATNIANYSIEGATVKEAVLTYNNPTTANAAGAKAVVRVYITDNTVEATGYYNVTVSGVTGYSSNVTQMNTETKNILITENTRPSVTSSSVKSLGATSSVITVNFSEAIASGAADANDFELYVDGVKVTTVTVTTGAAGTSIDFTVNTDLSDELAAGKVVKLVAAPTLDLADANGNIANVKEIVIK